MIKKNEENIIEVINESNKTEKIEVLKYFKFKNDDRTYIIYKNAHDISKNKSIIFSAEVIEDDDSITLKEINDENIVEKIRQIAEEIYNG